MQYRNRKEVMEDEVWVFALYSSADIQNVDKFYPFMDCLITEMNIPTNIVGTKLSNSENSFKELKPKTLKRRIEKENLTNLETISFNDIQEATYVDRFYPYCTSVVEVSRGKKTIVFDVLLERSKFDLDCSWAVQIVLKLNEIFPFCYGFMDKILRKDNPYKYVHGFGSDRTEDEELEIRTRWAKDMRSTLHFTNKKLRDVYMMNFLNSKHLSLTVAGYLKDRTLHEWILSKKLGELTKISEDKYLWYIDTPEKTLLAKNALREYNILV